MKMKKLNTILWLVLLTAGFANAQVAGKLNRSVNQNDTVVLQLQSTVGEIEWQKSTDSLVWETLEGVTDELTFIADKTTFFRVITTVEGCDPYISDMGSVTVFGTVTDIDGNVYKTVQIGSQTWMAENLRVTHYPDGTPILKGVLDAQWAYTDSMAFCWYKNDSAMYADTHGALYNWRAAMHGSSRSEAVPSGVQGVCPDGWHLPSDMEWQHLEIALGMSAEEAAKDGWNGTNEGAKLAGGMHLWEPGNLTEATHFGESGFNGLPTGDRTWDDASIFYGDAIFGTWWSATSFKNKGDNIWTLYLQHDRSEIRHSGTWMWNGNSVRCVKDE